MQPAELLDAAAAAHPRVDGIAARADAMILGLEIETAVKIERRAIAVERRADAMAARQQQIDMVGSGQDRTVDGAAIEAFEALAFVPFEARAGRAGMNGHPEDDIALADQPPGPWNPLPRLRAG